jgi:hypothetical protein
MEEFSVLNRTVQRLSLFTSSVTLVLRENIISAVVFFVYEVKLGIITDH